MLGKELLSATLCHHLTGDVNSLIYYFWVQIFIIFIYILLSTNLIFFIYLWYFKLVYGVSYLTYRLNWLRNILQYKNGCCTFLHFLYYNRHSCGRIMKRGRIVLKINFQVELKKLEPAYGVSYLKYLLNWFRNVLQYKNCCCSFSHFLYYNWTYNIGLHACGRIMKRGIIFLKINFQVELKKLEPACLVRTWPIRVSNRWNCIILCWDLINSRLTGSIVGSDGRMKRACSVSVLSCGIHARCLTSLPSPFVLTH